MKVSKKWINELVDLGDLTYREYANKMTLAGNEMESIKKYVEADNLVVGYITKVEKHPDANLNVCIVDIKDETLQIVCGGKNVRQGINVIVAKNGATLPGDFKISKTTIRGVESNGMICALSELGIENKYIGEEEMDHGIHVLNENAPIGENALEYLEYDDEVIDFELTADRGDLQSMVGMAYETAAILEDSTIKMPITEVKELSENINDSMKIDVTTDNCPLYLGRIVKNVEIKESPAFIKARLMKCGIRPINNVVDISNYVMLEYGQPLHFFDKDQLGDTIGVRMATNDEKIVTLDNSERTLKETDIVITNGNEAICLAGVMGGLSTEVTSNTKNIFIEGAVFNSYNIRYTSKAILRSEASARFEKGVDAVRTNEAVNRACYLLNKYANGDVVSGTLVHDNLNKEDKVINITVEKINRILGMNIEEKLIINIFTNLGFKVENKDNKLTVSVPHRRFDIEIEEDLIEEIGRIYGYTNMVGINPVTVTNPSTLNFTYQKSKEVKEQLQSAGLNEVITYSLTNEENVYKFTNDRFGLIKLQSPMSQDKSLLRHTLTPSLLDVVNYNTARNIKDIFIYELGKTYYEKDGTFIEENKISGAITGTYMKNIWNRVNTKADFYLVKGIIENLLDYLGLNRRYSFKVENIPGEYHPGKSAAIMIGRDIVGYFGQVHPLISKNEVYTFELSLDKLLNNKVREIKFKDVPKYPEVNRDIAFVVNKEISAEQISNLISKAAGRILKTITVFDVYVGENVSADEKSIAFNLTFIDENKTLTEEEITKAWNNIISTVESKLNAKLRN